MVTKAPKPPAVATLPLTSTDGSIIVAKQPREEVEIEDVMEEAPPPPSPRAPPPLPEPQEKIGVSTASTDIINAVPNVAALGSQKPPSPSAVDTRVGSMAAVGTVPTVGDMIGKYKVDRLIGSGGMGLVVAARHEQLNELVAIKLLRPKAAGDKIHAERFAREARAIIKIKSEHVVRVLDAGTTLDSGAPYIVMEYLVGRDLSQIVREEGALYPSRAADLMLQVCEAVASAHAVGVIHRDLKPSNFFVTQRADGTTLVKVLDFGISKAVGQDGVVDPNLTETQAVFGSPTYMSPEQIRSAKHVDHRSDVWSLGVGLYELLTGKLPFAADNVAGLLASIVADPPFFPRGFAPNLPQPLEDLLLACLTKDPKNRVQSVAELAFRLAPFASPNVETQNLLERIERLSKANPQTLSASSTAGPRLPQQQQGQGPSSSPNPNIMMGPPPMGGPSSSNPNLMDMRASMHGFGSTGMDLSSEAHIPVQSRPSMLVAIMVGLGIAALIGLGVFGAYKLGARSGPAPTTASAPPSPESSPAALTTVPTSTSAATTPVEPSVKVAATPSSSITSPPSNPGTKRVPPPKHNPTPRTQAGTSSGATPPPVSDPTKDRF